MHPVRFEECNLELGAPEDWDSSKDGECKGLPVFADGEQTVSYWELSWKERIKVLFFGHVWLSVRSGRSSPPVWISADRTIFVDTQTEEGDLKI